MRPFLSIVVPCWNCEKTIGRLLDSVLANNMSKEELQIVICDDKSTDNFLDIVKTYEDKLNITYCETTREFHCPGNTRQAALPYIRGEWFTFIDNDDMFEPDAFKQVKEFIKENNVKYTLVSKFREYFVETDTYGREFSGNDTDTWLHGKYFKTDITLGEFECHFKEDQFSHEDVFFNSMNLCQIISRQADYEYIDIFTYKWVDRPDSLSRSYFEKDHFYIESYLGDYITGASDPFFELFHKNKINTDFCINQIIMTYLHAYFYYQAALYRNGVNVLQQNITHIHNLKVRIYKELGIGPEGIIDYIYSIPHRYSKIRHDCTYGSCTFVEFQSFRDFTLNV